MSGDKEKFIICPDCGGSGVCNECDYNDEAMFDYVCEVCSGDRDCVVCEGSGEKPEYAPNLFNLNPDIPTLE